MRSGALVLLFSCAAAGTAAAQPAGDDAAARAHFEAGRAHYDQGRFEDAEREFEAAYRLSPRPQLLYNISQAAREAGHTPRAIETLRQFLVEVPDAPNRAALERRLRTMEEQQQSSTRTSEVTPGEAERGAGDGDAAGGFPVGPVLIAVGGVAVLAGLVTGWLALEAESDLDEMCPDGACPPSVDVEAETDRGQTLATVSDALVFGGLGVAATGLLITVLSGASSDDEPPVAAACGPGGCVARLRLRL